MVSGGRKSAECALGEIASPLASEFSITCLSACLGLRRRQRLVLDLAELDHRARVVLLQGEVPLRA